MRRLLLAYLLWVVVPASFALGVARARADRAEVTRLLESGERFGALAGELLMEEMGAVTGELAREAPVLLDPDTASPILRAAAQGDTVAALGTMSGKLVLSVALAEVAEGGEDLRIRAITETFSPEFPTSYWRTLGYSTTLFFRGQPVVAAPGDYGPEALDSGELSASTEGALFLESADWAGILSSLGGGPASAPTLHALVGPALSSPAAYPLPTSRLLLLLSAILGALLLLMRDRGHQGGRGSGSLILVAAFAVPMAVMWAGLLSHHRWMAAEAAHFAEGELVRVHAVLGDLAPGIDAGVLAQATGFGVTRVSRDGVESTLEVGPARAELQEIPPPTPGPPTTGLVGSGQARLAYAVGLSPSGDPLILSTSGGVGGIRGWILIAVLGSAANLLGLVFLLEERRRRRVTEVGPSSQNPAAL